MPSELQDLVDDLEISIVDTINRLDQAEMDLLYVGVLELEGRIEALYDALAYVADSIAGQGLSAG